MKTTIELLRDHEKVSGYKINIHKKESCELFFVKGKLETVRRTNTCDKEVTVYVDHGECKGDAQFFIYPSTTPEQVRCLIDEAVGKALLINNQNYELPAAETGEYTVESNFAEYDPAELASIISKTVFENMDKEQLSKLTALEESVDGMKRSLMASHFLRLAEGSCNAGVSPYYSSVITGLERVADHLVNVGFSITNPVGSQKASL